MQAGEKKLKQSMCYLYQDNYPDKNLQMQKIVTEILDREGAPTCMGTSSVRDTTLM